MTNVFDIFFQGQSVYNRVIFPTGGGAGENYGQPSCSSYPYIPVSATGGAPAAALPSGIVTATTATAGGSLTLQGALVSGTVATIDVCRGIQITCSSNLSTCVFTFRGTDFYGASMTHSLIGPSGNTLGTAGSFVLSSQCFKTVTTASVVGLVTSAASIGTSDVYDLPYRLPHAGFLLTITKAGTLSSTGGAPTVTAGQLATFTMTASSSSPRGTVQMPTTNLADGTNFITLEQILPIWATTATPTKNGSILVVNDTVPNTYGPLPFSN